MPKPIEQVIEDLNLPALEFICRRQGYAVGSASERCLRATVQDDYENNFIGASDIYEAMENAQ